MIDRAKRHHESGNFRIEPEAGTAEEAPPSSSSFVRREE